MNRKDLSLVYYKMGMHPWKKNPNKNQKTLKSEYPLLVVKIYYVYSLFWWDGSEELCPLMNYFWKASSALGLLLRRDLVELWSPRSMCAPGLWCMWCLSARYTYFVFEPVFSWPYNVCGGNHLCQYQVCSVSRKSIYMRNSLRALNSRQFRLWVSSALVIR